MSEQDVNLAGYCGLYCGDCFYYKGEIADLAKEPDTFRKPDGFFQPRRNRKVSAVALYKGRNAERRLEIYHNPFAINPIADSTFMKMREGVRQLIKASDSEMKWLE